MENRLIVWYDENNKVLGAFNSIAEAAEKTGIREYYIERSLRGSYSRTKEGWRFLYEVKASDLRKERIEKEKEKMRRIAEKFEGE